MYVCVCKAVTDSEVQSAIDAGAHTLEAVALACRAGSDCGACRGMIADMIEATVEGPCSRRSLPLVPSTPKAA